MLWTIISIIFIVWLVGLLTKYTFGGLIHLLLAVVLFLTIYNLVT
ncbi:lmo0937 family membrane protein [Shimazuella sp. AN120528]|nr:lmo0937 family membrane protein [Shimazuella soli]MCH5583428.1 lmo0937 family membrane protein [Shimazuella soli]